MCYWLLDVIAVMYKMCDFITRLSPWCDTRGWRGVTCWESTNQTSPYLPIMQPALRTEVESFHTWYVGTSGRRAFCSTCTRSLPLTSSEDWCPWKRALGCLMSPPCLQSQGCHLIPLCYLLSCFSAWSCYPFYLIFSCLLVRSSELFPKNSSIFFVQRYAFLYDSCLFVIWSKFVSGMCSMLPYNAGNCYYVFI